jgi:hypothetical protein
MLIMGTQPRRFWRQGLRLAAVTALVAGGSMASSGPWQLVDPAFAQDPGPVVTPVAPAPKKIPPKHVQAVHRKPEPREKQAAEPAPAPAAVASPASPAPATPTATEAGQNSAQPGATPFDNQVKQANLKACSKTFIDLGKAASANGDYMAMSEWNQAQPEAHSIQSIIGMNFKNAQGLRNGASVVFAAPVQNGCEGNMVRIVPTPQSCNDVAKGLGLQRNQVTELSNVPVATTKTGIRFMLLAAANSCVIVTVARGIQAAAQ